MSPPDRAVLLQDLADEDPELGAELSSLLAANEDEATEVDEPLAIPSRLRPDEVLLGRFKILRHIGAGGMGDVYEALDLELGQSVALKTLNDIYASNPHALTLLKREVQLARRVSGPNICRIHEFFVEPGINRTQPIAFLTMEFLDGITLEEQLRLKGRVSWTTAKEIVLDICAGLTAIHQANLIHRDLKPRNIMMVQRQNRVCAVLMDFGIALETASAVADENNALAGTLEYMAPEQFEGKATSPATDIYSLGVVLYELVTGVHPFPADTPLAAAVRRASHPRPVTSVVKGLPKHWDHVIAKCINTEPPLRYQSATEVSRALSSSAIDPGNLRRDRPWLFAAMCAIPLVAIAWAGTTMWRREHYYRPNPDALRWYQSGVAALHEGTYVRAVRALQQAIDRDPNFPMAHARMAEALEDLDFESDAQRELLIAMPEERQLSPIDRMYLSAISATISDQYDQSIATYSKILHALPAKEQSAGNVDLGMAYEHTGDIEHALTLYAKAAALDPSSPAPYMHTAVLENRLLHTKEADKAFETAGKLFEAELNQEGLAELEYEQGYALNSRYKAREAKQLLERALREASAIDDVQLQVRAQAQIVSADYLISTEDSSAEYKEATEMVDRAARLARDNRLDSWLADGLVRRANAQIAKGEIDKAEETVEEALGLAKQTRQLRVQALGNLTLASVMAEKGRTDQVIAPAQQARDYLQKHGYLALAEFSSLLLTRAQRDQGQYDKAIASGNEALAMAKQSGIRRLIMQSEETVASIFAKTERYTEALPHYKQAILFAEKEDDKAEEMVQYAAALWQIGRYAESDEVLNSLPKSAASRSDVAVERVSSLLSRQRYKEAQVIVDSASRNKSTGDQYKNELAWDKAVVESLLGPSRQRIKAMQSMLPNPSDETLETLWDRRLMLAIAELASGLLEESQKDAAGAAEYYSSVTKPESQFRASCTAAIASRRINDDLSFRIFSNKVIDLSAILQQNWGPDAFRTYLNRPDVAAIVSASRVPVSIREGKP